MKKSEPEIGGKVPVDVRIVNVQEIPAKYFLHSEVAIALRSVIRSDVVVHGAPIPPGAEAIFGSKSDIKTQTALLRASSSSLMLQIKQLIPGLLALAFIVAVIALAVYFVGRAL